MDLYYQYIRLGLLIYSILLIKSVFVVLLNEQWFGHLRWLDCFVMGRYVLGPRVPAASKYCAIVVCAYQLVNRAVIARLGRPYKRFCFDFIRLSWKQLGADYEKSGGTSGEQDGAPIDSKQTTKTIDDKGASERVHHMLAPHFVDRLDAHKQELLARPTRLGPESRLLAQMTLLSLFLVPSTMTIFILLCTWTNMPVMLTRRGFEISYKSCVRFLIENGRNASSQYHWIYQFDWSRPVRDILEPEIPFPLPFVDLSPLNLYNSIRMTCDVLECYLIYTEMYIWCAGHVLLTVLASLDVILYARQLRARLGSIMAELRRTAPKSLRATQIQRRQLSLELARDIRRLQSTLQDFFNLIAFYNQYIGAATLINMSLLLIYSFVVFVRALRPSRLESVAKLDGGVQVEFYCFFCSTLAPCCTMLASAAVVESRSRHLYKIICNTMALEVSQTKRRTRWITILRHYHPKKLYCFNIMNSIELSWLSCLKIFSWTITALVIIKSI